MIRRRNFLRVLGLLALTCATPSLPTIALAQGTLRPLRQPSRSTRMPNQVAPVRQAAFQQQPQGGGKDHLIRRLELKQTTVIEAARLLAELSGLNIVATEEAAKKEVTLFLQNSSAIEAVETLAKVSGLWYREDDTTGTIRLMTTEEYQRDLVVFRDDITKVFTLLHPNALSIAVSIEDLYGPRVILSLRTLNDDDLLFGSGGGFGGGFGGGLGTQSGGGFGNQFGTGGNQFGGGFNQFGGGGSGFGGFNNQAGGGRFSRRTGGNFFGGGIGSQFGGGFGAFNSGVGFPQTGAIGNQNLTGQQQQLTPGQISAMEQRLQALEQRPGRGVSSELVREVTQGEPPVYVTINRQHNLVIVRTSDADAMRSIERLILEIDRPTPEVLLEMKILEVTIDDDFHSIFDLQFSDGPQGPTREGQGPFFGVGVPTAAESVLGAVNAASEGGSMVYQFLNTNIRARVELLERESRIDTLATPLLLASNNRPASIFVGEERVLVTGASTAVVTPANGAATTVIQPTTEIRDIGTTLLIVPKINADRTVTLFISQDNSTVNERAARIPISTEGGVLQEFEIDTVNTANIQGTVVAKDGLTVAIGGLIQERKTTSIERVPVLGRLPGIGFLFRREVDDDQKKELVLLITPHVIMTPSEGEFRTHWRIKELSEHPYVHPALSIPAEVYERQHGGHVLPGPNSIEMIPQGRTPPEPG